MLHRFLLTAGEALAAGVLLTVVGVPLGVLLHRVELLRRRDRDLGRGAWRRRRSC